MPSAPAVPPASFSSRLIGATPWLFLVLCFAFSVHYTRIGWNNPLLDFWSFRETQTAISTRSVIENGFQLDYATPVLGAPWSIPFEFPTYHFCVAALVKVSGLPLEPAGRCVSLFFGYGSFLLAGLLVGRASGSRAAGIYTAALALVSPVYIYGSRAFVIESTALCFTLAMLVGVQAFLHRPRWRTLGWLVVAATLAGLTKATTYAVGLTAVAGLILLHARPAWKRLRADRREWRLAAGFGLALAVSFGLTLLWTWHTDVLKGRNEFAAFITSAALHDWNYGTWAQRLELKSWDRIVGWAGEYVLGTPITWIVGLAVVAAGGVARGFAVVLVVTFASASLAFTNLYLQHQHYLYANGIYLLALLGLGLGALWDRGTLPARLGSGLLAAPLLAALLLWGYTHNSLPGQNQTKPELLEFAAGIRQTTPAGSAILIYGYDWESALPYYANRYAIMDRRDLPADDPRIQRAITRLDRPLGGFVFMAPYREQWHFILQQIHGLGTGHRRLFSSAAGDVYSATDGPEVAAALWQQAGFADVPGAFASPAQICLTDFAHRSAMLVHAPGLMVIERRPGDRRVHLGFGLPPPTYAGPKKTDGVTFIVDFTDNDRQTTRLFERRLDPAAVAGDRGPQSADLALPANREGSVIFKTETGPGADFDWSVWQEVRLL